MDLRSDVETLMQKEMDRKDFIKHVGIGFAAILGITTVLKAVNSLSGNGQKQTVGYSSGVYGGQTTKTDAPKVSKS